MTVRQSVLSLLAAIIIISCIGIFTPYFPKLIWNFIFTSLMGWSVGALVFNALKIDEKAKNTFFLYIIAVVILTAVGAFFSDKVVEILVQSLESVPEFSDKFVLHIGIYFWSNGWVALHVILSILVCSFAFLDSQAKTVLPPLSWLKRRIQRNPQEQSPS